MTGVRVFAPVGRPHRGAGPGWHRSSLGPLQQATVAIVDNTKPNARALMAGVADRLVAAGLVAKATIERKASPSEGISDAAFGMLEHEAQIVLVGSAD